MNLSSDLPKITCFGVDFAWGNQNYCNLALILNKISKLHFNPNRIELK